MQAYNIASEIIYGSTLDDMLEKLPTLEEISLSKEGSLPLSIARQINLLFDQYALDATIETLPSIITRVKLSIAALFLSNIALPMEERLTNGEVYIIFSSVYTHIYWEISSNYQLTSDSSLLIPSVILINKFMDSSSPEKDSIKENQENENKENKENQEKEKNEKNEKKYKITAKHPENLLIPDIFVEKYLSGLTYTFFNLLYSKNVISSSYEDLILEMDCELTQLADFFDIATLDVDVEWERLENKEEYDKLDFFLMRNSCIKTRSNNNLKGLFRDIIKRFW